MTSDGGVFASPSWRKELTMKKEDELALKATKEIVVKFIEVGRLSVSSFQEVWNTVHGSICDSLDQRKSKEEGSDEP